MEHGSDSDASGGAERVSIRTLEGGRGVRIDDRIERRQCEVATSDPVSPTAADTGAFRYPVDTAVSIQTETLSFLDTSVVYVHAGEVQEVEDFEEITVEEGTVTVEVSSQTKLYAIVEAPLSVEKSMAEVTIRQATKGSVILGARSYHERPATTITTTEDPVDLMAAVSRFGSALKTESTERSYPTLRGHPPALEIGSELSIPEWLPEPDGDVRIEVPADLRSVLCVSSLSYYLDARLEVGECPTLFVGEAAYPLDGPAGFETTVERTLKRVFFLDCLSRTAGSRPIPLYERRHLEDDLEVDLGSLYDAPIVERLQAYLTVPYDTIAEYLPTWKLTAHVVPEADTIEMLPFLVDDLAVIRTPGSETAPESVSATPETPQSADPNAELRGGDEVLYRGMSSKRSSSATPSRFSFVEPDTDDSLEQTWVGPGTPIGASKAMPEAFHHYLDQTRTDGDIGIVVVCNDEEMIEERDIVSEVYGSRENLSFEVSVFENLTTDRLRLVLESDLDYFHYIGHVDEDGFECSDGMLDAACLDEIGIDVFFLNACRSYTQGETLIRKGAVGGVVTLDDIVNTGAVRIGKTMARLLNHGFPLRGALDIAEHRSIVGSQYLVIGDGNVDIAQAKTGTSIQFIAETRDDGYDVEMIVYPTRAVSVGAHFRPAFSDNTVYLCPGRIQSLRFSEEEFSTYLSLGTYPVILDGEFCWSDQISSG